MFLVPRPVLLAGAGLIAIVYALGADRADSGAAKPADCAFRVSADVLNVRSDPHQGAARVDRLNAGEQVEATANVVAGFREIRTGRWTATEFLTPLPGSACVP
ncbi:SH3 domain-containing protein [Saccharopolyspora mangrovi]|uniref:SH3 domain-containing protein n=1 Tax=Saccharopolyspora mangrovi TaxID=3082379 RepID=A0ABU6ALF5_9PSEU|nr:SH3 domain-containing protein [Saccharopolyspora sp. S2-29]MEB3372372.1 SH3 domain-containing protein [Saccharopolyspora sp. S2-29]